MSENVVHVTCRSLVAVVLIALVSVAFLAYAPLQSSMVSPKMAIYTDYVYHPNVPQEGERVVSIIFDDGWLTPYTDALPILDKYGFKATFAVVTSYIESYRAYMDWDQVVALYNQGHDIASHSANHINMTGQTPAVIADQLAQSKEALLSHGINAPIFVYPFGQGAGNPDVEQIVQQHYLVARGIQIGSLDLSKPFNPLALPANEVENSTSIELFKNYVEQASGSTVVILFYHQITDGSVFTSTTPENFDAQMQYLHDNNFTVRTLKQLFTITESSSTAPSLFILDTNVVYLNSKNPNFYTKKAELIL
ncbi:MAG: polysaccharide deacetylase family protein [Candidatus Bathyarchaeota archaeon]|nr:polysaccharide deacetylase family protein [Candidatus Termiticorpusculum sp.]